MTESAPHRLIKKSKLSIPFIIFFLGICVDLEAGWIGSIEQSEDKSTQMHRLHLKVCCYDKQRALESGVAFAKDRAKRTTTNELIGNSLVRRVWMEYDSNNASYESQFQFYYERENKIMSVTCKKDGEDDGCKMLDQVVSFPSLPMNMPLKNKRLDVILENVCNVKTDQRILFSKIVDDKNDSSESSLEIRGFLAVTKGSISIMSPVPSGDPGFIEVPYSCYGSPAEIIMDKSKSGSESLEPSLNQKKTKKTKGKQ